MTREQIISEYRAGNTIPNITEKFVAADKTKGLANGYKSTMTLKEARGAVELVLIKFWNSEVPKC